MSVNSGELFSFDPERQAIWKGMLLKSLEAEAFIQENGVDYDDNFQGLTVSELMNVGKRILQSATLKQAYSVLAQSSSNGETHYDRLIGIPQHAEAYKALAETLDGLSVDDAVDVGAATGACSLLLKKHARNVTAIDFSEDLLAVAKRRYQQAPKPFGNSGILETMVIDINQMNFPSESFDIVVSNAVTHYLTMPERIQFYKNVHRFLRVGGLYFEPRRVPGTRGYKYGESLRGELVQRVASAVLFFRGKHALTPYDPYIDFSAMNFDQEIVASAHWPNYAVQILTKLKTAR